jgi:hypothetical protein
MSPTWLTAGDRTTPTPTGVHVHTCSYCQPKNNQTPVHFYEGIVPLTLPQLALQPEPCSTQQPEQGCQAQLQGGFRPENAVGTEHATQTPVAFASNSMTNGQARDKHRGLFQLPAQAQYKATVNSKLFARQSPW